MSDRAAKTGLKFAIGLCVYGLTTAIVIGAFAFWWAASTFQKPGPLETPKLITIEKGQGLNGIARRLQNEGAIRDEKVFIVGTRILGAQSDLKAGEYQVPAGASPKHIMAMLRDHDVFARRVTLREGLTSFEIVRTLKNVEELSGEVANLPPEGSLLPNTYDYQLNEDRSALITRLQGLMVSALKKECEITEELSWDALLNAPCGQAPLSTVRDVLTLASIVEKETSVAKERSKVAGVFINRLKIGMALQTDPTVIYAITKGKHKNDGKGPLGRRLLKKDLQIDNPYNTYKYPGLPPGPIANPGLASIQAVLNPAEHAYLYFVADGTGGHAFGKTLAEHNANVAKWRKIRKSQN